MSTRLCVLAFNIFGFITAGHAIFRKVGLSHFLKLRSGAT